MTRIVKKYNIFADDDVHQFTFSGNVLTVDSTRDDPNELEFWVESSDSVPHSTRNLKAFNTGQIVPDDARYQGTTKRTADGTIWHLYEVISYEAA